VVVTDVVETSPAALAGLAPGDIVLHVDGRPATVATWEALSESDRPVRLLMERAGCRRELVVREVITKNVETPAAVGARTVAD
jgi:C-terminal processing protease CtpA/Prc